LPHSGPWYVAAAFSLVAGTVVRAATSFRSAGYLLLFLGLLAAAVTVARCIAFARRTDLTLLPEGGPQARPGRWRHRAMIAWMHFLQPIARMRGQLKGWLQPPEIPAAVSAIPPSATRPTPRLSAVWAAIRLLAGASAEDRFWSERWFAVHDVLRRVIEALQLARISGAINIADGWDQRRDLSVALGRWAWFDLSAVVEEHAGGRVLARIRAHLRPTFLSIAVGVLGFGAILVAATSLWTPRWSIPSAAVIAAGVSALALGTYRTASTLASLRGVVRHALEREGAQAIEGERPTIRFAPDLALWRYASRSALASLFVVGLVLGSSLLMRDAVVTTVEHFEQIQAPEVVEEAVREFAPPRVGLAVAPNGDLYVSDADQDVIRRVGWVAGAAPVNLAPSTSKSERQREPETVVGMATPGGVAVAPNGDLYIADTESHRIYRVDRVRGTTIVVAGTGRPGFAGDGGPAGKAMLNQPASVAIDKAGNLFVADTANHRIRKIAKRTGVITTLAGTGTEDSESGHVGDEGPATSAQLSWPMDLAVASTGDVYVADTGHNRIRRIDHRTGIVTTVAGDGSESGGGDGGPAVKAGLSSPTGLALVARKKQVTLYIADSSNGRVRVVTPDGMINSLALPNATKIGAPSRVAYHPRGFLYVAGGENALAAVSLATPQIASRQPAPVPPVVRQPSRRAM
jgi:sugar lactone lactonase YvrE